MKQALTFALSFFDNSQKKCLALKIDLFHKPLLWNKNKTNNHPQRL